MGILYILANPPIWEFGATKERRAVSFYSGDDGIVAIMGNNGMFYTNTVGSFGVASAGWGVSGIVRLARLVASKCLWWEMGALSSLLLF